jgi:hypothetical protein
MEWTNELDSTFAQSGAGIKTEEEKKGGGSGGSVGWEDETKKPEGIRKIA